MWKVTLGSPTRRGPRWTRRMPELLMLGLLLQPIQLHSQDHGHQMETAMSTPAADTVPLYDDLGDHRYQVTTDSEMAQAYFNQGLRLYYAFNHSEAIRSFKAAQEADPECAMCFWGESLAWGPNINMPMDAPNAVAAFEALGKANAVSSDESPLERGLIQALASRYEATPSEDRAHHDAAYASAMGALSVEYPSDNEIGVLFAESLMDTRPWDYWTEDGAPQEGIADALASLDAVLDRNENHPGACHFYIHAVEKLYPERAISCAERLAALMPGAGHIVHMPGHIYIRVGRYRDAIEANKHAVHADETYIQDQRPGATVYTAGYYPHNYDFLAFAALMLGEEEESVGAAERVEALIPIEMFGEPGMDFLEGWSTRSLQVKVRFERWDEILQTPAPPSDRPHALATWYYAQGRAHAAVGNLTQARAALDALRTTMGQPEMEGLRMEFNASLDLLAIAENVLAGWIEASDENFDLAVMYLERAVEAEDALLYGEPPEWSVPTRQDLGAVLLLAGRRADAVRAFEGDLAHFPQNFWSLRGLAEAGGSEEGGR